MVLGHSGSLAYEPWPQADDSLLVQSTYNLPVQVRAKGGGCRPGGHALHVPASSASSIAAVCLYYDSRTPRFRSST